MPWTLTIQDLNAGGEEEVRSVVAAVADLLAGRGYHVPRLSFQPTGASVAAVRRAGECAECGSQAGLHALSCSRYPNPAQDPEANHDPEPLSDSVLAALRGLQPYAWYAWPMDSYDQGLPIVEVRQTHLAALLAEVKKARDGR